MLRVIALAIVVSLTGTVLSAQGNYRISPGDVLSIEVLEDPALNRQVLVLPDGNISFPLIGTVRVGGRTVFDATRSIKAALLPNFAAEPTVTVLIQRLNPELPTVDEADTISVYLIGQVNSPGRYDVEVGTTVLQFLAESGGFTSFAATKRLQIRRRNRSTGGEQVFGFNYRALERGQSVEGAAAGLRDGDVIVVPERRLFE